MSSKKLLLKCMVKCLFCMAPFLQNACVEAITTRAVFAKYPNKYFIETGSHEGDGIQMALEAGFEKIYSIELSMSSYAYCQNRFKNQPKVTLLQGDSTYILPQLLERIDAPATFWLDGHYSEGITAKGETNTPILSELESIQRHPIKTHTIMIDDVRQFGTREFDFIPLTEILKKIYEINPEYSIFYEHGYIANDVLIARIP